MLGKSSLLAFGWALLMLTLIGGPAGAQVVVVGQNSPAPTRDYQLPQRASEYAAAEQMLRNAREARDQARAALQTLLQNLRREAQTAPERLRAVDALAKAREAYSVARDRVLAQLRQNADYLALKNQGLQIDRQIKDLHARMPKPGQSNGESGDDVRQQVLDLSDQRMRLGDRMTTMEANALQESGAESLRDNWIAAKQRLDQIEAVLQARIDKDPAVAVAQARLTDALSDLADIRAQYAGAEAGYRQAAALEENQDQLLRQQSGATVIQTNPVWGTGVQVAVPSSGGGRRERSGSNAPQRNAADRGDGRERKPDGTRTPQSQQTSPPPSEGVAPAAKEPPKDSPTTKPSN